MTAGRRGGVRRCRGRAGALLAGLIVAGPGLAGCGAPAQQYIVAGCERGDLEGHSVARAWDEELLSLIRQVVPAPGVHARNLFHLSAAMWDAWAAYDQAATGYVVTEKHRADDATAAREAAISYAAYRILDWRYATVADLGTAREQLDSVMASLCYRTDYTTTEGDDPAALGNRIGAAILEYGKADGSLEDQRYADMAYQPMNPPLEVAEPGTSMIDADRWQPLSLAKQIAQNGLPVPGKVQTFIGHQWGHVTPFALPETENGVPIDPGPPPRLADPATSPELKRQVNDVLRKSAELDATDGVTIDIGPGAAGDSALGTNDGDGHDVNPATGEPYAPNVVLRGDFSRVLAEFWADGPESETPPGHWNLFANQASDAPGFEHRIGGTGPVLDRLEWDVKLYFALNGAVHDAAIAAWGLKAYYESARPISLVRYLARQGAGQRPVALLLRPRGDPPGARSRGGDHPGVERPGAAPRRPRRPRRGDRRPLVARQPRGPEDPDEWRRLGQGARLGPLPAPDLRHAGLRRVRVGAQHLQPGGRRGAGGDHGERVLPRRAGGPHGDGRLAPARGRARRRT